VKDAKRELSSMTVVAPRARASSKKRRAPGAPVRFRITPVDPKAHLFEVVCEVAEPVPDGQRFSLPAWIPGSYMIREFARHIVSIEAESRGAPVALVKTDKHSWLAAACDGPLQVRYRVYAWDPSVRAAHLDEGHAFFNGTSVFLRVDGFEHTPIDVDIAAPPGRAYRDWKVATTLPEHGAERHGFGTYRADDYDALIDHPVEMGRFRLERFDAAGVPHEIAYTGAVPNLDAARVNSDVAKLCAAQIRFFDGSTSGRAPAPFDRYLFLTAVSGDGYGGLEHRASTALICSRDALPVAPIDGKPVECSAAYLTFLGLVSHEYFHSWNVKRIKPAAFVPYDLAQENYTSLLWIFEGFTSYYDDLFLVRTGLASQAQYFGMLARVIDDVLAGSGRKTQSVAESSFDAWVKYYRQDENAANAVVSYYKKGSLVALCLDLLIRRRTAGKASLDDVMRLLWRRYGRDFYAGVQRGVPEDAFPALVREATGVDVRDEVRRWAYGTEDLPLAASLAAMALSLEFEPVGRTASIGARVASSAGEVRLTGVAIGGAAHEAGLSAGDVLVAIDDLRVQPGRLDVLLARHRVGDVVRVIAFRGDALQERRLMLASPERRAVLEELPKSSKAARKLRDAWLQGDARA
jgi:predicted metalloprotease with PDZ domain